MYSDEIDGVPTADVLHERDALTLDRVRKDHAWPRNEAGTAGGKRFDKCLQIVTAYSQEMTFGLVGVGGDIEASVEALEALSTQVPAEVARKLAQRGDTVLFSPAATSFSPAYWRTISSK